MNAVRAAAALAAGVLIALVLLPPVWHLPIGVVAWGAMRFAVRDVHRTFGRPRRWLQATAALCLLGAVLGPTDAHLFSLGLSWAGALSATTMVVRAFALVALASLASSVLPIRKWTERIRHPVARRLIEVVIIAANLVPVQLRALAAASTTLRERRPGLLRLPHRMWLLAVHSSLRAATLAESVAFDMVIAAHNGGSNAEE